VGLAVAVWGAPRATKDIDLLVRAEDVERAVEVARGRGFDTRALEVDERLRRASELSDLTVGRRLDAKNDMSASGVESRLREASDLLDACLALGAARPVP
jgi:hypothetical protein